ncbi:AraC family transcriptional regulator [Pseudomaricurvus alkylphenolicus]|uniref:AraC family transcriptional regulator n=1 Tax=Pseudomaricurvus alkylphenolicus TaxID=1306991 RepID=UPI00141E521E|nr:AraC family transcriptional regulator [Pseudomaricurvus alkylphenolicus]NIB40339.1 AraC family transcriptional regulator [Pseudomaricurvus alkylphenolicus]
MKQHLTVSSCYVRSLVLYLERSGYDVAPLLEQAEITRALLADSYGRVPGKCSSALWRAAMQVTRDPLLGIRVGSQIHDTAFNALGPLMLNSSSLGEALEYLCNYFRLLSDNGTTALLQTAEGYELFLASIPILARPEDQSYDAFFAMVMRFVGKLFGRPFAPIRIEFIHPAPVDADAFEKHFGCPVHFNRERNLIIFEREDVERQLPTANPDFAVVCEQFVIEALARSSRVNFAAQVFSKVLKQLPQGDLSQELVAKSLNVSVRTMQLHLQEEGASFKQIVDVVRRDMADKYLADERLTINEVCYRLGFSCPSNFARAFRRWTGDTPSEYREKLIPGMGQSASAC